MEPSLAEVVAADAAREDVAPAIGDMAKEALKTPRDGDEEQPSEDLETTFESRSRRLPCPKFQVPSHVRNVGISKPWLKSLGAFVTLLCVVISWVLAGRR